MTFTAKIDQQSGDCYLNISQTEKRLVRATVKTYEKTGSYVFLKLFKKPDQNSDDYKFDQRIGLTMEEFTHLSKNFQKIKSMIVKSECDSDDSSSEAKPPPPKKVKRNPETQLDDE